MDKAQFLDLVKKLYNEMEGNVAQLPEEDVAVKTVDEPLVGFAAADDPVFVSYKQPEAIGKNFKLPAEYLDGAKTVIAFFFPYSEEIRTRHARGQGFVDEAWTNGYPRGSKFGGDLVAKLQELLAEEGIRSVQPAKDPDNKMDRIPTVEGGREVMHVDISWSNRHACYAAGLGTFGVHRHIITDKGCCGTLGCLIIDAPMEATERTYTGIYDNCTKCGRCTKRCPANAITVENLRNLKMCAAQSGYIRATGLSGGCGKCLVGIPCEAKNPRK